MGSISAVNTLILWGRKARDYLRPARIASTDALAVFLGERAAYITQKSAVDYCRGKTGLSSFALFTERTFQEALAVCQWETVAAVLADLLIVTEGRLRSAVADAERARLRTALGDLYPAVLGTLGRPEHRPEGWSDVTESFTRRFAAAHEREPLPAADVGEHSARRLFDTLPINAEMRKLDEEIVYGAVRFRMVAVAQEIDRRIDKDAVVQDLLRGRPQH